MKIGILSDTHDRLPLIRAALDVFGVRRVGAVLHAGDVVAPFAAKLLTPEALPPRVPLHVIYGNNDGERAGLAKVLPQIRPGPLRLQIAGRCILMLHWIEDLAGEQLDAGPSRPAPDVIVTGHTHEPLIERRGRCLHVNPGEACGWLHGRCTAAILETEALTAEIIDLAGP